MQPEDQGAAVMSESESVPVENNVRKAASEEKAPADDKQDDGNSAAEERSDDEEPKLGLLYQPLELSGSLQRKNVERLYVSFRTAARERPPPEQGKGTPLGDCPHIEHNINRERSESLKVLHRLLFGRPGAPSEIKKNLCKFSGFPFEKDSAEYVKRQKMVAKLKKTAHKDFLAMLHLEKSGTVEECTDRILNFLLKPFDNKKVLLATKKGKRKSMTLASAGKGQTKKQRTATPKAEKGKASRKRPAKKTSTPAKWRKVAKKEDSDEDDKSDEKEVPVPTERQPKRRCEVKFLLFISGLERTAADTFFLASSFSQGWNSLGRGRLPAAGERGAKAAHHSPTGLQAAVVQVC
ncbi:protein DEK [Dermacentor silvarum]|uniref:protein DEK n=1 Tax=Dermacentor silvarum TaxID=543639 RepID=UPI001896FEBC|nr:protein DEK [Dermacentor silvarum]